VLIWDPREARSWFGFGVAGNFAGHLEQAGEAGDFATVVTAPDAPKGVFPFYVPGKGGYLETFPLSSDEVRLPESDVPLNLQIEPEAAVLFRASYDDDGMACSLEPVAVGAFNDCSIRRPDAKKLSEKKNWGPASKGLAASLIRISELDHDGRTATLRIASFLRRDGETHAYGQDSPVVGYSYYGQVLLDWIIDRLHHQLGSDDTPLEPVGHYLRDAGSPEHVLVAIGATRYTEVGESTYLVEGDESVVVVYDADVTSPEQVAAAVAEGREASLEAASVLVQKVRRD
jgi:hypothetical protein